MGLACIDSVCRSEGPVGGGTALNDGGSSGGVADCGAGQHRCGAMCLANSSVESCGSSCVPCGVPSNGAATCEIGVCEFVCSSGYFKFGDACLAPGQYLKASNIDASDQFGAAVALSSDGTFLAVGAPGEGSATDAGQGDNSRAAAGAVYIFKKIGLVWSQQAFLKAENATEADLFGSSLALNSDGSVLAVGAPFFGFSGPDRAGDVYIFERSGIAWSQQAKLSQPTERKVISFGNALALNAAGNSLVVGAYAQSDSAAFGEGAAYVFSKTGSNWSQQARLKASNIKPSCYFGRSVAMNAEGTTIAIGASGENSITAANPLDVSASGAGAVYIFSKSTTWTQQAYLKPLTQKLLITSDLPSR
jgi:FG-GAP repeat